MCRGKRGKPFELNCSPISCCSEENNEQRVPSCASHRTDERAVTAANNHGENFLSLHRIRIRKSKTENKICNLSQPEMHFSNEYPGKGKLFENRKSPNIAVSSIAESRSVHCTTVPIARQMQRTDDAVGGRYIATARVRTGGQTCRCCGAAKNSIESKV